jgi:hypothetical protein
MVEVTTEETYREQEAMYIRQCGYTIHAGHEEQATALCTRFVEVLRRRGVRAHVLVGGKWDAMLQLVEEYPGLEALRVVRRALECDEGFRSVVSAWAAAFYPLVQTSAPAMVLREQQAAPSFHP